jgi:hypothetical protein
MFGALPPGLRLKEGWRDVLHGSLDYSLDRVLHFAFAGRMNG